MKELIEDYKRKLENAIKVLGGGVFMPNSETIIRVKAKASCYRTFITELERVEDKTKQNISTEQLQQRAASFLLDNHCGDLILNKTDKTVDRIYASDIMAKFLKEEATK